MAAIREVEQLAAVLNRRQQVVVRIASLHPEDAEKRHYHSYNAFLLCMHEGKLIEIRVAKPVSTSLDPNYSSDGLRVTITPANDVDETLHAVGMAWGEMYGDSWLQDDQVTFIRQPPGHEQFVSAGRLETLLELGRLQGHLYAHAPNFVSVRDPRRGQHHDEICLVRNRLGGLVADMYREYKSDISDTIESAQKLT